MPTSQDFSPSNLNSYVLPAVVKHNSRGWYVEYYAYSPLTCKTERVRENLNKLRKRMPAADFQRAARTYCANLNARLAGGWSPFVAPGVSAEAYKTVTQAMDDYRAHKFPDFEKSTRASYDSLINLLLRWLSDQHAAGAAISSITHQVALRYMDYRGATLSNNGYNTDLKKYRSIFGWLKERSYIAENPFTDIKPKKKQEKTRVPITPEIKRRVVDWCRQNNPGYLLMLHLIYNSLIRPKEIVGIQIKHVNLEDHYILIPADIAKTDQSRRAPLTADECRFLESWHLENYPQNYYLLGIDYVPSRKPTYNGKFKKDWEALRPVLDIPKEMQLYSWKDTGISDMFVAGIDALTIMRAADHKDLGTTTKYSRLGATQMIEAVREKAPSIRA